MRNQRLFGENLGSAYVSCAGDGVLAITNFFHSKTVATGRRNQHSRRARYPDFVIPYEEGLL